jgi:putative ABC transport system permease protein
LGWRAAADENKRLGDRISFLGTTFTVVGIIQTGSAYEDGGAVIDLREAQQLLKKPHQVMMTQIKLVDPRQTDAVLAKLLGEYPELLFSRSAELTENLPDMENMNQMIFAVLALTLVVGSITLMNTMVMSVYERTREIGVLRAVGWRSAQVLWQMLSETLLLTLFSGAIGVGLTFLLIQAMRVVPSLGIWRDMFEVTPRVVLQALVLCVVLGLLGGMFPAWRASRLRPVEALRYE